MLRIRTLKMEAAERLVPARAPVRGEWAGGGTASLGLEGRVRRADLVALLGGDHPHTGERLCRARRVVGFDVILGAPKGVSLLHAFAGPRAAREVSEGLLGAAAAALAYLERSAAFVRRGAAPRWESPAVSQEGPGVVRDKSGIQSDAETAFSVPKEGRAPGGLPSRRSGASRPMATNERCRHREGSRLVRRIER